MDAPWYLRMIGYSEYELDIRTLTHLNGVPVFRFSAGNIEGMVVEARGLIVSVFRGTDHPLDAVYDVNVLQRKLILPYPDSMDSTSKVRVHSGFLSAWKMVRGVVLNHLVGFQDKKQGNKYVFIGHSLGGALAQLASLDFQFWMSAAVHDIAL